MFGLQLDLCKDFWKELAIVVPFLSLKGAICAYLLKKYEEHSKYGIHSLYLLISCISARSAPQMLFQKELSQ